MGVPRVGAALAGNVGTGGAFALSREGGVRVLTFLCSLRPDPLPLGDWESVPWGSLSLSGLFWGGGLWGWRQWVCGRWGLRGSVLRSQGTWGYLFCGGRVPGLALGGRASTGAPRDQSCARREARGRMRLSRCCARRRV